MKLLFGNNCKLKLQAAGQCMLTPRNNLQVVGQQGAQGRTKWQTNNTTNHKAARAQGI